MTTTTDPTPVPAAAHPLRTTSVPRWQRRALRLAESALYWSGAAEAFARLTGAAGATAVTYHAVTTAEDEPWIDPANALTAEEFEAQVRFLARRRRVVPMSELVETLRRGESPPRRTVAITFDDGYRNTLDVAAPILDRYSLPAILYVPTGCIARTESPWIDDLYAAFRFRTRHELRLADLGLGEFRLGAAPVAERAYAQLRDRLVVSSPAERSRLLTAVAEQLEPSARPPRLTMNWDEIRALRARHPRFEIGVHSVDHVDLTSCDPSEARRQVEACIADVTRELAERPRHFSCPYNRTSPHVRSLLAGAGYASAVSAAPTPLLRTGSDLHGLGRLDSRRPMTLLALGTGGAWPTLPRAILGRDSG